MRIRPALAATATALAAASCSTAAPPPAEARFAGGGEQQCVYTRNIRNFAPLDHNRVLVSAGANRTYQLELFATCPDIDWSQRIAFRSSSGSSWLCHGLDAELLVPSPIGLQRCPVLGVRRLTPEEAKAALAARRQR